MKNTETLFKHEWTLEEIQKRITGTILIKNLENKGDIFLSFSMVISLCFCQ